METTRRCSCDARDTATEFGKRRFGFRNGSAIVASGFWQLVRLSGLARRQRQPYYLLVAWKLRTFGVVVLALTSMAAKDCGGGESGGDGAGSAQDAATEQPAMCGACPRQVPEVGAICLEQGLNCYYPQPDRLFHCGSFGDWEKEELGSPSTYSEFANACPDAAPEPGTPCSKSNAFEWVSCDSCSDCISCTYFEPAPNGCGGSFHTFVCDGERWQRHPDDATRPWQSECETEPDAGPTECIPRKVPKSCTCTYPPDYVGDTECSLGERSAGPEYIDETATERTVTCTAPDVCTNAGGEWHIFSTCYLDGRQTICCGDFSNVECVGTSIQEVLEPSSCCW